MIKKIVGLIIFFFFLTDIYSAGLVPNKEVEGIENSLLWKISGNGLQQDSYLFGTMHNVDRTFLDSISGFRKAFIAAKQLAIEHDIFTIESNSSSLSEQMLKDYIFMPKDTTYSMLYSSVDFQFIDSTLRQYTPDYAKFKPEFWGNINISIVAYEEVDNIQSTLDRFILLIGYQNNKVVHFMETVESIIQKKIESDSLGYALSLQDQADNLLNTLKYPDNMRSFMKQMKQTYLKQELSQLSADSLVKHIGLENSPELDHFIQQTFSIIIDTRNKEWIKKIISMIHEDSSLIAVGAGHLPGVNGLIALLRHQGYSVEPVKQTD
ncbi:MAG: TraB/GumN family protein [Bacteroidales bacterium]